MKPVSRFVVVWLANFLVIFVANSYYPTYWALGNSSLSPLKAAIFSSFLLTVAGKAARELLPKWEINVSGRIKKFLLYWVTNSAAIWFIARFAFITGFGVSTYYYAILLGFVACLGQWLVRQVFKYAKLINP